MQSDISIKNRIFYGNLWKKEGFDGFSKDPEENTGHFLAVQIDAPEDVEQIDYELVGGVSSHTKGSLDGDKNLVVKISDKNHQALRITTKKSGSSETLEYRFYGLKLNKGANPAIE